MGADRPEHGDVTRLLYLASGGDQEAFERAFTAIYDELRGLASRVRHGRAPESLGATALVHEAYLRLMPSSHIDWEGRRHFLRVAARAMRQVLARAARDRLAEKRGGGASPVTLDDALHGTAAAARAEEIVALDEALERLTALDARKARVVELRWFVGLTAPETADALGLSTPTVERDWRSARAWLLTQLRDAPA
jgi:RNA polymerase sigma factor (TIGR02999 family)